MTVKIIEVTGNLILFVLLLAYRRAPKKMDWILWAMILWLGIQTIPWLLGY